MELLQLKYFCYTAECESISKTAARFCVPPSNISQTIKRLEDELGVELFERTPNRIKLNRQGKIFADHALSALETLDNGRRQILENNDEIKGDIRLLVSTNRRIVTIAIEEFRKFHPNVNFKLSHKFADADYDLCISDAPVWPKNAASELLLNEKMLLAVRKDMIPTDNSHLSEYGFVSMGEGTRLHHAMIEVCHNLGFEPKISVETDDPYYVRRYVDIGIGVAIVPSVSWHNMFSDNVALINVCDFNRSTYVYYKKNKSMSRTVKEFLSFLKSAFKNESAKVDKT